ncbi:MAG: hypothetical protein ACMVP2_03640 [Imperialibacter sp.]|uniref:hypothetical protein n=1 Tax=Imperialibacter sp. TaxID=2038411 RepID=UPI003A854B02
MIAIINRFNNALVKMSTDHIQISIPLDDDGFLGRECLKCKRYFKLKPGTGQPTRYCHCPYCDYEGDSDTFWTPEQNRYLESMARKIGFEKYVDPMIKEFTKSLKELESESKGSMFQIKVKENASRPFFPIHYYSENHLETVVECDSCNLEFAIYGVFSRCPDCTKINSFSVFKKSLEVSKKQFELFEHLVAEKEIIETNLKFILSNSISSFDGLGKDLRTRRPDLFPKKPLNLFQNLDELEKVLQNNFKVNLAEDIDNYAFIKKMFQVRHICEHNMGVIDQAFITKTQASQSEIGKKYELRKNEISAFLAEILELGKLVEKAYKNNT